MRFVFLIIVAALFSNHLVMADQKVLDKEIGRPRAFEIEAAVKLVPSEYQKDVFLALRKSGRNAWGFIRALQKISPQEREGLAFLIANMSNRDLVALKGDFLVENDRLAYQVMSEVPWGRDIPQDIFLNDILPYATLNEHRDDWRGDFYERFINIARKSKTIDQAVKSLNSYVFDTLHVSYNATKRPKPDQSPYESTQAHYASCTGLSILLTDALRSVGIPARIVGTSMWADESGNHTWVEIWDGQWHYIGAAEGGDLDHTWFTKKASQTDAKHNIYASSFKKTALVFPMRWAPNLRFVSAVDVTEKYKQ